MKLSIAAAAALTGLASALSPADVYIFRPEQTTTSSTPPQLPRQLARLILQHRLSVDAFFSPLRELASLSSADEAASHINAYGRTEKPLFSGDDADTPSQLLIVVEGVDDAQMEGVLPGVDKAFTIREAPSSAATGKMLDGEFVKAGVGMGRCEFERAVNPLDRDCWDGPASILRYDVKKDAGILDSIRKAQPKLARFAETGEMETTILLLPESTRASKHHSWSTHPSPLLRREERVISALEVDDTQEPLSSSLSSADDSSSSSSADIFPGANQQLGVIPACFKSLNACESATNTCSGHGYCRDKWAAHDDQGNEIPAPEGKAVCFSCHCQKSERPGGGMTYWGGKACEKVDVSMPFSLFVGFSIFMAVIVVGALGMLLSLGGEPLPGVLGAGVSRK